MDRNAPLPNRPTDKWSWQEAKEIVLTSFEDFSPEISKIAKLSFIKIGSTQKYDQAKIQELTHILQS